MAAFKFLQHVHMPILTKNKLLFIFQILQIILLFHVSVLAIEQFFATDRAWLETYNGHKIQTYHHVS